MTVSLGDQGATEKLNWICKTMPEEGTFMPKETMRGLHMEDKEIGMYAKVSTNTLAHQVTKELVL